MLVVSLRSVNLGFLSHLKGIQDKMPLFLAINISFMVAFDEIMENAVKAILKWYPLGVK